MKGLLLKDTYQLVKQCKVFFLIDVFFLAAGIFLDGVGMFALFPVMLSGTLPITLLSLDERSGWNGYRGTLPYTDGQIVSEKYMFGLIVQAATSVIVLAALIVKGIVYGDLDIMGNVAAIGAIFAGSLVFPALCLPFCFKFGTEKGRIVYFIVIALIIGVFSSVLNKTAVDTENLTNIGRSAIVPCVMVIPVYAVSWAVSVPLLKSVKH